MAAAFARRRALSGRMPPPALRILIALVAGLALGTSLPPALAAQAAAIAEPVGGIWLDLLRMTIVPLVFALLVRTIADPDSALMAGGVTRRAMLLFAVVLVAGASLSAVTTNLILDAWPLGTRAAEALRAGAEAGAVPPPVPLAIWVRSIVPANAIKAAADGAMLPLIVFALLFGFAATRVHGSGRTAMAALFTGIADTMLVIIGWLLWLAPVGVFALALTVGAKTGLAAVIGFAHYMVVVIAPMLVLTASAYVAVMFGSRVPIGRFARGVGPAQSVAASTESSLASLPAMLAGAAQLRIVPSVRDVVLPLAVALFRASSPAANLAVALYVGRLFGIEPSMGQLVAAVLVAALVSLAAVSLPGQVNFFATIVPIAAVFDVPVAPLALLLAVETVPDIMRTVNNVTWDLAATAIVAREGEAEA